MDRAPMVGRDGELESIADAIDDPGTHGVIITGAAGVGKSRLAHEAVTAADARKWQVHHARCTAFSRAIPFAAFASFIRHTTDTGPKVERIVDDLVDSAAPRRLLIDIDDADHLDERSAHILRELLTRTAGKAVLTVRTGSPAAESIIASWADLSLRQIRLAPLARHASDALARELLGGPLEEECSQQLWERTRGNVLFLRHLIDQERSHGRLTQVGGRWSWVEPPAMSPSLRELVLLQIGAMPANLRDVADIVAVAESIGREQLDNLVPTDLIDDAQQRGLLATAESDQRRIMLAHPLYAEALLSTCAPSRLAALRQRVAVTMADEAAATPVDPIHLGLLWLESDLPADPEILLTASSEALDRLDIRLAERFARAAVVAGGGRRARIRHAKTLHMLGRSREGAAVLDDVAPENPRETEVLDKDTMHATNLLWPLRRPDESARVIDDAIRAASGPRLHWLRAFRALQFAMSGNPSAATTALGEIDDDQLTRRTRITALHAATLARSDLGQITAASAAAEECRQLLGPSAADAMHTMITADVEASALTLAGFLDRAAHVARLCRARCHGLPGIVDANSTAIIGVVALRCGDVSAALENLDPDHLAFDAYAREIGQDYLYLVSHAEALAVAGDTAAAETAFDAAAARHHPSYGYREALFKLAGAWLDATRGHLTAARRSAEKAATFARDRDQLTTEMFCLQTAVRFGNRSVSDRLAELTGHVDGPRGALAARYARAVAANDPSALFEVSQGFEDIGDLVTAAGAAAQSAVGYLAAGLRGSALSARDRALSLADRCGFARGPAVAEARVLIPFTPREREVANLVAQGMTNREIAASLALSVRTVEEYVNGARAKAGVTSRAGLADLVRRFDAQAA